MSDLTVQVEDGLSTIIVSGDQLENFPQFINSLEGHGEVRTRGAVKVRLQDGAVRRTSLEELLRRLEVQHLEPEKQMFHRGSPDALVYGYTASPASNGERRQFCQMLSNPSKYFENTCCSAAQIAQGKEAAFSHYWKTLHSHSQPSVSLKRQGNAANKTDSLLAQRQRILSAYESGSTAGISWHASIGTCMCADCEESDESDDDGQEAPAMNNEESLMYSAGIQMKGEPVDITPGFSLSKLKTILDVHPHKSNGLTTPYFYLGATHSSFVAHIEDASLWSINFVHYGHNKVWIVVPPEYVGLVDFYLSQMRLQLSHTGCRNLLGHNCVMPTPTFFDKFGIPYTQIVQRKGEFVILYPNAVHLGFNMGCNIVEAVNFATESWIPLGMVSPRCTCLGDHQIHLDMTPFIVAFRPDLLQAYLDGSYILSPEQHPFSLFHSQPNACLPSKSQCVPEMKQVTEDRSSKCEASKHRQEPLGIHRLILQCPACVRTYKGGVGRLDRLLNHIKTQHKSEQEALVKIVNEKYPKRELSKNSSRLSCPVCYRTISGSSFHLKDHIRRVHKTEEAECDI